MIPGDRPFLDGEGGWLQMAAAVETLLPEEGGQLHSARELVWAVLCSLRILNNCWEKSSCPTSTTICLSYLTSFVCTPFKILSDHHWYVGSLEFGGIFHLVEIFGFTQFNRFTQVITAALTTSTTLRKKGTKWKIIYLPCSWRILEMIWVQLWRHRGFAIISLVSTSISFCFLSAPPYCFTIYFYCSEQRSTTSFQSECLGV